MRNRKKTSDSRTYILIFIFRIKNMWTNLMKFCKNRRFRKKTLIFIKLDYTCLQVYKNINELVNESMNTLNQF